MTIETLNLTSLVEKTVFLHLRFGTFGNFRKSEVELNTTAVETRFRKQKMLLDSPQLKSISKADLAIKTMIYEVYCLPGKELQGMKLVPTLRASKVGQLLKNYRDVTRPALIDAFMEVYESQREQAEKELKDEFNPALYPTTTQMRAEFEMYFNFVSFDVPAKLEKFDPELFKQSQEDHQAKIMFAAEEIIKAMRATALLAVEKLHDGLTGVGSVDGKPKKLFAAHIENLKTFIGDFNIMNCGDDAELAEDMAKLAKIMEGVDIDKVRENDTMKDALLSGINDVANHMVALAEPTSGRKFRKDAIITAPAEIDISAEMKKQPEDRAPGTLEAMIVAGTNFGKQVSKKSKASKGKKKETVSMQDIVLPSDETLAKVLGGAELE